MDEKLKRRNPDPRREQLRHPLSVNHADTLVFYLHPIFSSLQSIIYDKIHYELTIRQLDTCHHRFLNLADNMYRFKQLKTAALGRISLLIYGYSTVGKSNSRLLRPPLSLARRPLQELEVAGG